LVEFDRFLDQGEAEAGAFAASLEVAEGKEAFEDFLAGIVGNAGAVILNLEGVLVLLMRQGDTDGFAARGKVDGVFQQVGDSGAENEGIAEDGEGEFGGREVEVDPGKLGHRFGLVHGAGDGFAEVEGVGGLEAGFSFEGGEL